MAVLHRLYTPTCAIGAGNEWGASTAYPVPRDGTSSTITGDGFDWITPYCAYSGAYGYQYKAIVQTGHANARIEVEPAANGAQSPVLSMPGDPSTGYEGTYAGEHLAERYVLAYNSDTNASVSVLLLKYWENGTAIAAGYPSSGAAWDTADSACVVEMYAAWDDGFGTETTDHIGTAWAHAFTTAEAAAFTTFALVGDSILVQMGAATGCYVYEYSAGLAENAWGFTTDRVSLNYLLPPEAVALIDPAFAGQGFGFDSDVQALGLAAAAGWPDGRPPVIRTVMQVNVLPAIDAWSTVDSDSFSDTGSAHAGAGVSDNGRTWVTCAVDSPYTGDGFTGSGLHYGASDAGPVYWPAISADVSASIDPSTNPGLVSGDAWIQIDARAADRSLTAVRQTVTTEALVII